MSYNIYYRHIAEWLKTVCNKSKFVVQWTFVAICVWSTLFFEIKQLIYSCLQRHAYILQNDTFVHLTWNAFLLGSMFTRCMRPVLQNLIDSYNSISKVQDLLKHGYSTKYWIKENWSHSYRFLSAFWDLENKV